MASFRSYPFRCLVAFNFVASLLLCSLLGEVSSLHLKKYLLTKTRKSASYFINKKSFNFAIFSTSDNDTDSLDTTLISNTSPLISQSSVSLSQPKIQYPEVLAPYIDELTSLRGTPELVDKLEMLVNKFPGIELDINLYRLFYPFELDDFQIQGLSSLMAGNNVLVSVRFNYV